VRVIKKRREEQGEMPWWKRIVKVMSPETRNQKMRIIEFDEFRAKYVYEWFSGEMTGFREYYVSGIIFIEGPCYIKRFLATKFTTQMLKSLHIWSKVNTLCSNFH